MNKVDDKMTAESVERSISAKRNSCLKAVVGSQKSKSTVPWQTRIRLAAKRDANLRFANLLHHITPELLKEAFYALKRDASKGVDGVSWKDYEKGAEERLLNLHDKVQKVTYRASPSRRVMIPKQDGRERPLGIPTIEDKIVQQALVWVLECIYEIDFKGFSYGFRPDRSCHNALDAVYIAITQKKVSWILDADIQGFFDTVNHEWMMKFLEHRISDQRILRLIKKFLIAGISVDGRQIRAEVGTPQGAVISPLLANIYLHYVLDLWVDNWRRKYAQGEVYIIRYADDFVIGFQYRKDAEYLKCALSKRLGTFSLVLHPEKTRLIEFGRFAIDNAKKKGKSKPETFNFLGFTHYCSTTRGGVPTVKRKTIRNKLKMKLQSIRETLRNMMHAPVEDMGRWLRKVVTGHLNYFAVPSNREACGIMRTEICKAWFKVLRRRSHKARCLTWKRFSSLVRRWIPSNIVKHPYPNQRLIV
jgi:group II intron reverse transcriptase/maturase